MVYCLGEDRRYGKPDYYRRDESVRSDALEGSEIAAASFLPGNA
jgi:hypothetical protein